MNTGKLSNNNNYDLKVFMQYFIEEGDVYT